MITKVDAARGKDLIDARQYATKLGMTTKERIMDCCRPYGILFTAGDLEKYIAKLQKQDEADKNAGMDTELNVGEIRELNTVMIKERNEFLEKVVGQIRLNSLEQDMAKGIGTAKRFER